MKNLAPDIMRPSILLILIFFGLSLLGCSSSTGPESVKVPLALPTAERPVGDDVLPQFVVDAVLDSLPKATLIAAAQEEEDGEPLYEVLVETAQGTFEVDVDADGNIVEIETASDDERPIAPQDLPAAVLAAVEATVPGGRITESVRESVRGGVIYDVEVDVRGEKYDLEIAADGTVLEVEEG